MGKKTNLIALCFIFLFCGEVYAQSDYLSATEEIRKTESVELGGKCAFVFLSKNSDLVITSSVREDGASPTPRNIDGMFHYELIVPTDGKRVFSIAKKGTALRAEVTRTPQKDKRLYYIVTEVANPITYEDQSGGRGDAYFVERKACIQFITPIAELQVQFSPKLGGKLKKEQAQSGANVIKLEIDIDSLNKYRNAEEELRHKKEEIDKTIKTKSAVDYNTITDAEWALHDKLADEYKIAEGNLIEAATIRLWSEGTNVLILPIDKIRDITVKSLTSYGILMLKEKVFASKYDELMHQAKEYMERHDYELAKAHYSSAAQVSGISEADKITAERSMEKMATLDGYKKMLDEKTDELYMVTNRGGTINKKALFAMMDNLIELNKSMGKETGDSYYLEEATRLAEEKQKVGLVFKGRFVMSEYKGGVVHETPITNVRIYGSQDLNNDDMDSPKYRNKGELVTTVTSSDGKFSFNYKPGKYCTFIFEAIGNDQIKVNKHVSVVGRKEDRNVKIRFPKK